MPARLILALMLGLLVLPVVAQDEPPPTGEDTGPNIESIAGSIAEQIDEDVMVTLGLWYDPSVQLRAEQGDADAQFRLGVWYDSGLGVPQDREETARWWQLAAHQGHAGAQNGLGVLYENGYGVPQDYIQAHMWYNLAASNSTGDNRDAAVKSRDLTAKKMTPEDLSEAQRLTSESKLKSSPMATVNAKNLQAQRFNDRGKLDPFIDLNELIRQEQPEVFFAKYELPPLSQRPPGLAGLAISEVIVTGLAVGESPKVVLLRGTDNFTYIAQEDAKLFNGYVSQISLEEVVFVQLETDRAGNTETSEIIKRLFTEEEEKDAGDCSS
jgi:hypothetical protein